MNLVASGQLAEVLAASSVRGLICPRVAAEALYIEGDAPGGRDAVDLTPFITSDALTLIDLTDDEMGLFVTLAAEVDDGEAQVLAVAANRKLRAATDDRRAARTAARLGVVLLDTPALLLAWAKVTTADGSTAIKRIEDRAHYHPASAHVRRDEWIALRDKHAEGEGPTR